MSPEAVILRNIKSKYFSIDDKLKRIVKKDLHYVTALSGIAEKKEVWIYSKNTCIGHVDFLLIFLQGEGGKLLISKQKVVLVHNLILHLKIIKAKRPTLS